MKQLTNTRFFLLLKGRETDLSTLEQEYDNFVALLFSECVIFTDRTLYHNILVYTRIELSGLVGMSGKKSGLLSPQSYRTC